MVARHRMTPEKRAVLRVVVAATRASPDSPWLGKVTLARLLGKPLHGVSRSASVLIDAGYLRQKEGRYQPTDKGSGYYDRRLANPLGMTRDPGAGRPAVIDPEIFDRAREMLAKRDDHNKKVHTQADVAKRLDISVSTLYLGLDPERKEARAKRRNGAK